MDLPALRENIQNISASVFKLLHNYAAAGLNKGDNCDLVVAAFKVSFAWIFYLNTIFIRNQGEFSVSIYFSIRCIFIYVFIYFSAVSSAGYSN
jgi:hypothetical protein